MQKERAIVQCEVRLSGARDDKLRQIATLTRSVRFLRGPFIVPGTSNRNSLIGTVEYGPVWGGWESDVRKRFHKGRERAGSSARLDVTNLKRTVIARR